MIACECELNREISEKLDKIIMPIFNASIIIKQKKKNQQLRKWLP